MVAFTIGVRIRVHGTDHVERGRSYVYMANHSSLIDTPALFAYLPHQFKIMAKKELFYVPFMGWHLWTSGNFPIDRGDARRTARSVRAIIDGVRAGKSLAVFPEGTRTPDGRLQEFKPGTFKIAIRAGVPIVPVTIRGTLRAPAEDHAGAAARPRGRVHRHADSHGRSRRQGHAGPHCANEGCH